MDFNQCFDINLISGKKSVLLDFLIVNKYFCLKLNAMKRINISQIDTIFADGSYPIEFLLFYKDRIETRKICTALNELSTSFWPIFGEYSNGEILFDKYCEDDCFNEEVIDQEFDKGATNHRIYENYYQINSHNLKKLFFLKIIQYRNGTLLIPKMNHLSGTVTAISIFCQHLPNLPELFPPPLKII